MRDRPFWGWYVVLVSVVGLACSIATTVVSTFGVFLGPVRAEFGWSQSEAFAALLAVTLTTAILAPIVGGFVDRFGARRIVLFSFCCEALIFASFALQTDSLWAFYGRYVALAVFGLGTTHVAFARVITLWFDRRRGLALGIALSGIGVGGVLWPVYMQTMIDLHGWRVAYVVMGLTVAAVALPVVALLLKDNPEALGQAVDGDPVRPAGTAAPAAIGLTLREALRTRRYWMTLGTFFLIGLSVQSILVHVIPLLTGRGVSPMIAALAQSLLFFAVTTGRLVTGWLLDRFFAPRVACAFLLAPIVGIGLLALGASEVFALVGALLVGLAVGAEVDVLAYLTGRYFGSKNFSAIYGTYYGVYSLSGGIGPLLTAMTVDRTGGYDVALWLFAAALFVSCILLLRFERFPLLTAPVAGPPERGSPPTG